MKARLEQLQVRIDAMSLRERALLFASLVALVFILWNTALVSPLEKKQQQVRQTIDSLQSQIANLDAQSQAILTRHNQDPNAPVRAHLAVVNRQLSRLDAQIEQTVKSLVPPRQMAKLLEAVLAQKTRLKLIKVESLGSRPLVTPKKDDKNKAGGEDSGKTPEVGVYRHDLRLTFEGDYLATLDYLRALQEKHKAFFWDGLDIVMEKYPTAMVTITVHTLSLDKGWIGV